MDSISRYCLLAYLRANPDMSHGEVVQFIEGMQPMEVDVYYPQPMTAEQVGELRSLSTDSSVGIMLWPPDSMG